jgi:predicted site-specific integrase-resolvase
VVETLSPIIIRRELFKLFYLESDSNAFGLNEKADASEAFSTIISILHASCCKLKGEKKIEGRSVLNLDEKCEPQC